MEKIFNNVTAEIQEDVLKLRIENTELKKDLSDFAELNKTLHEENQDRHERFMELKKENTDLKLKIALLRKYIYGNYDLEYKEMQLKYIDEYGEELK